MELREATQAILSSDRPSDWLKLADMYMHSFNQMPEAFVLPAKHALLKPLIESFHDDLETFVLKQFWDEIDREIERRELPIFKI